MGRVASEVIRRAREEGRGRLLEPEAKEICNEYGIPVTRFKIAKTVKDAVRAAEGIGYPVVLKVLSPDVVHKSDVGGVILNIRGRGEVEGAFEKIMSNVRKHKPDARIVGVLVQEMAPWSTEVIVGAVKDPQFGPVLMFGLGGVFVEVLGDVVFRVAPITEEDAREMVKEIKGYPILMGIRGREPVDIDGIVRILLSVSKLVTENLEINEIDLNPIMVYTDGAKVVDARVVLSG